MGRRILFATLTLVASAAVAAAQTGGRIAGRVSSTDGRSLPGIQVSVTGAGRGAISDTAGRFQINDVAPGARTVVARGIGFAQGTQAVAVVANQTATADFSLTPTPAMLNPIVTVGYGEQERRSVTGAVGTVSAEKLKDIPTSDPMKALQGRVAGVEIVANGNEPGSSMQVRVRGVRSLRASNDPLYVVDGIPISGGIQDFNPQMIESIDVLKDASATAIYGSRGANGVILVTMKKGSATGLNATYSADMYYGDQSPVKLVQMKTQ